MPQKSLDTTSFLISKGVELNANDLAGKTALFHSIEIDNGEIAKFLVDAGADTMKRSYAGILPMSLAKKSTNPIMKQVFDDSNECLMMPWLVYHKLKI